MTLNQNQNHVYCQVLYEYEKVVLVKPGEDGSNDAENSALLHRNKLYFKVY